MLEVAVGPPARSRRLPVHYAVPDRLSPETPVLLVLHGIERNAREYLEIWQPLAARRGYLLAAEGRVQPPAEPRKAEGIALARDGKPLDRTEAYATRFVGTGVDGERSVKGVVRIEAVTLGPTDDPADLETLTLDDPAYG